MILDRDGAIGRVTLSLSEALGTNLLYGGSGQAKVQAVTAYASFIADAWVKGALGPREMARELDEIAHMTRRWVASIRGLPGSAADTAARLAIDALFASIRADLSLAGAPLPRKLEPSLEEEIQLAA